MAEVLQIEELIAHEVNNIERKRQARVYSRSSTNYLSKILRPGETIVAEGKLHWCIYFRPIILLVGSIIAASFVVASNRSAANPPLAIRFAGAFIFVLLVCTLLKLAVSAWLKRRTTEIAVTNRRVIYKTGLVGRRTAEMNMDKVESVLVDQSVIGRLLNYGTIHVRGTGVGLENLHYINSPISLRNAIIAK